jgi:hypothetical protein
MAPKKRWLEYHDGILRTRRKEGWSCAQIARELSFSSGHVRRRIDELGLERVSPGPRRNAAREERDRHIREEYERGASMLALARKYELTDARIWQIINRKKDNGKIQQG